MPAQRDVSTEAYLELVVRYSSGEHDAVAAEFVKWSLNDLQKALRDLPAVLPVVSKRLDLSEAALVGTAMVVHVDVARRTDTADEVERFLVLGHKLADLLPKREDVLRFRARWHHAAGTTMFGFSRPADALRQFQMAHAAAPGDPSILLALGSAHEIEGAAVARHGTGRPPGSSGRGLEDVPGLQETARLPLSTAATLYEAALAVKADLDEARVRLARTRWLLGEPQAAADAMGDLADRVSDPYLRYISLLVDGAIKQALGRGSEGIARYRQAAALCPRCPSAMLALSYAALDAEQRGVAREIVERLVTDELWPPAHDPWWTYQQAQWHAIDTIVAELRREVPT